MKSERNIPLTRPLIQNEELEALAKVLDSRWLTTGKESLEFTEELKQYIGCEFVLPLSSCTAALHLALLCSDIGPGDEVITTPLTFAATVNTIIHCGAKPVLADIAAESGNISLASIENCLTPRTKAVMIVHFAGEPCELDGIRSFCESKELLLLEDAAHAIGSRYGDEMVGESSYAACFSFHPAKNITTIEGGALATNSEELYEKAKLLSFHGIDRSAAQRVSGEDRFWAYAVRAAGYKYNISDVQAALGRVQLGRLDSIIETRRALVAGYVENLRGLEAVRCDLDLSKAGHSHHLYFIRLTEKAALSRDNLALRLRERGIGCGVHYIPIPEHPFYQEQYGWKLDDYPVCEEFSRGLISLPLYNEMTFAEVEEVCVELKALLG